MHKAKHSKFKNTGILFELLTRQLTSDILSNKDKSVAKDLLFRYFGESKELGKELQLYNYLLSEQFLDDKKADRALNAVLNARRKLNNEKLKSEKYELIKEIKQYYPIDSFLKAPIKNYKSFASIYKIFSDYTSECRFELDEIIQARECLIENLVKIKSPPQEKVVEDSLDTYKKQDEATRLLAYKFLIENLNKKYDSFSKEQKRILREYINNISNTCSLPKVILEEIQTICGQLTEISDKIDSKVTKIKVLEVVNQLKGINLSKGVKDNHVCTVLMAHELLKEIKSVLNEK